MIDAGSHHFIKASASSDRVLVPQPSNDPSDPLVSSTTCHDVYRDEEIDRSSPMVELEQILESFRNVLRDGLNLHARSRPFVTRTNDSAVN